MPLSERWTVQAGVSPGIFSDLDNTSGDAFRMPARLFGIYKYSERTQFTVGAVYLDREDVSLLPALGVIHRPTDRTTLELILPRPRVVQQFWGADANGGGFGYVAGELGGGVGPSSGTSAAANSWTTWRRCPTSACSPV